VNRFILHPDPLVAAQMHCDKHVLKMVIEEAQMLSTVHRQHGYDGDVLYRATHKNHPCTVWAGESVSNYRWAWRLFAALCAEYRHRYGKTHGSARLLPALACPPPFLSSRGFTDVPQAMPEQYHHPDPVTAYRRFYVAEKARFATWRNRPAPDWWPR
jgi:hypothetical protein